jgi:hypothetical protein
MAEERSTTKEYDATHGSYKSSETEVNTAASAMPAKDKPLPFKATVGNTNADK